MLRLPSNTQVKHMERTLYKNKCFAIECSVLSKVSFVVLNDNKIKNKVIRGWLPIKNFFNDYIKRKYGTDKVSEYFRLTDNCCVNSFFYFKYIEDAQYCIDKLEKFVISVREPLTEECYKDMVSGKNIAIKNNYFEKKYKYKIEFEPIFGKEDIIKLHDYIWEYFDEELKSDKHKIGKNFDVSRIRTTFFGHTYWNWNRVIYLGTDDDFAMFSLMFSDKIDKITKVKLFSEFSDYELKIIEESKNEK